jgi:hypothetical protein
MPNESNGAERMEKHMRSQYVVPAQAGTQLRRAVANKTGFRHARERRVAGDSRGAGTSRIPT